MDSETQQKAEAQEAASAEETQAATETEATQEAAPAESEAAAAEGTEEKPAEEAKPDAEKHKRAGGFQRKIERLEREKEVLLLQLQATGRPAPPAAGGKEKSAEEKAQEYLDTLVDKRLQEREAQRQAQAQVADFQKRTAEVRAAKPDFDEVVSTVDIPTNSPLGQAILTSEAGPDMLYELAANPAELARISALPPLAAARELGRLEAKLASGAAPKTAAKPVARKPAPPPIAPVTARGPSTVKRTEDMSYEEYSAWRRSQSKR